MNTVPFTRHAVPTRTREEAGEHDFWHNLPLGEQVIEDTRVANEAVVKVDEDTTIVVEASRDTLLTKLVRPRVCITELRTKVVIDDDADYDTVSVNDSYRRSVREWVLKDSGSGSGGKTPTPKEQKEEADKLVSQSKRKHNPALVEAIKQLPEPEELVLRFPKPLTHQQRKAIEEIAKAVVKDEPVKIRVSSDS